MRLRRRQLASGAVARSQVLEIQRSRLVAGAVGAIDELGYAQATVGHITSRARISRRTFYELFANREECLAAVLDDVAGIVGAELAAAGLGGLGWRERVRAGLAVILVFFDREPVLARVCIVQALRADPGLLGRREELLAQLAGVVDEGRLEGARGAECSPLTAEGLVGAAFSIVYARLLRGDREPLVGLTSELMGMIVLPYLGPAASRRELAGRLTPAPVSASVPAVPPVRTPCRTSSSPRNTHDPLEGVQMRLTYRTARVLTGIAESPGASNRMVGDAAGVSDPGQISKLLRRLQNLGLLTNTSAGHLKGEPNAWTLTAKGERVAQSLRLHGHCESEAA